MINVKVRNQDNQTQNEVIKEYSFEIIFNDSGRILSTEIFSESFQINCEVGLTRSLWQFAQFGLLD